MKYTKQSVTLEASKYRTRQLFKKGASGCFEYARKNKLLDEILPKKIYQTWTIDSAIQEALQYKTQKAFMNESGSAYWFAKKNNLLHTVCAHIHRKSVWSLKSAYSEALKYQYKIDFRKGSGGAHSWLEKRKLLDDACSHMTRITTPVQWTDEKLKELVDSCSTIIELKEKSLSAYQIICRTNRHDMIKHLERSAESGTGIDYTKPAILYHFKIYGVYKIGITTVTLKDRYTTSEYKALELLWTKDFDTAKNAMIEEQKLLKEYHEYKYKGIDILKSGNSELLTCEVVGAERIELPQKRL